MSPVLISEMIGFALIALVVFGLAVMRSKKEKQFKEFDENEKNNEEK